jgi:hypothetical protein
MAICCKLVAPPEDRASVIPVPDKPVDLIKNENVPYVYALSVLHAAPEVGSCPHSEGHPTLLMVSVSPLLILKLFWR